MISTSFARDMCSTIPCHSARPRADGISARAAASSAFSSRVIAQSFPGYGPYIASKAGVEVVNAQVLRAKAAMPEVDTLLRPPRGAYFGFGA